MPFLRKDDIALYYDEAGGSGRPIVLLHGWCCDHSYMAAQVEHFAKAGHRVFAPDFRGHGKSDKPKQSYTMQGFGDDIAWMCGALSLAKPVIVGHSMGGIVAYDIAARHPGLPAAIVMMDAAVAVPATSRAGLPALIEALRGPDYAAALRGFVGKALFIPTDDPALETRILDGMCATPHYVMLSALEGLFGYDPDEGARHISVPSLYIAGDEASARSDMARLRALVPHMLYGQVVGSGHFCQVEVPSQVNAMIDRFLAVSLPS